MRKYFIVINFFVVFLYLSLISFAQPVVSFTPSQNNVCAPVSIQFTNTTTGCTGNATYYWQAGTGDVSTNQHPTFYYSNGGNYNVSLTVNCDGFEVTETIQIVVYNQPTANFVDNELQGCVPFSTNFTNSSTQGDAPITSYQWYFGDGNGSDIQNPSHTYQTSGNFNVSLIVTDANGCTSQYTKNAMISVANPPQISFYANNTNACFPPLGVTFYPTINTSFGLSSTQTWNFGDGSPTQNFPGNTTSVNYTYNTLGLFSVSLTVEDSYGCSNTLVLNDYIRITDPEPLYSVVGGSTACLGSPVNFVNETTYSCSWNFGDGTPSSTLSTPTHVYSSPGNFNVTFTIDPGGPCQTSTTFNIFVEQVTASFTTSPQNLYSCSVPFTVNFINQSSSNATGFFYVFQDGGSSNQPNPSHTFTSPGVYQPALTVTTNNNCSHTFIGPTITINVPNVSFTADTLEGCEPLPVNFTYNGTTPVGNITNFNWNFGNGQTNPSGGPNASSTYNSGEYTVSLSITDNNGCQNSYQMNLTVGSHFNPTFDVVTYMDHFPLPSHYLCPQDTVELYLAEWNNPNVEFNWWIDSTDNNANQEYQIWTFDRDTGWITVHMISNFNGCRDTLLWDSVYIYGPIIQSISKTTDCDNPLNFVFTLNQIEADYWDWYIYSISGTTINYLAQITNSTQETLPYTFPMQSTYWVKVVAYNNSSGCEFKDSIQVNISSPMAIFSILQPNQCINTDVAFFGGTSQNATQYYWDWGDGTNSGWINTPVTTHAWNQVGYFTVTLTVRDGNGCENSMSRVIHILGPAIDISYSNTIGCNSLSVDFEALITTDDPVAWIMWEFGDGSTGFGANVTHNYTSPGVYSVKITVTTVAGCQDIRIYQDLIVVSSVSVSFSSPNPIACVGENVNFVSSANGSNNNYYWDFGDGSIISGNSFSTVDHAYNSGGYYDIYLKVTNEYGCESEVLLSNYVQIQQVSANFSLLQNYYDCYPVQPEIVVNNTVIPAGTQLNYQWIMGTNDTINIENPAYLYTIPGSFTIVLNVSTNYGCSATHSENIVINGPYAEALISDTTACVGQEITFQIVNQSNVESFIWVVGGGYSYNSAYFTHSYDLVPPLGYYPVNLSLTSGGCNVSFVYNIWIFDVTAGILITDEQSNIFTENGACAPVTALLTSNSINDVYRYWYINNNPIGTGLSQEQYTFTNTTQNDLVYNVSLKVEDQNGCTDSISTTFIAYPKPLVDISNDTLICRGDAISLFATGGTSYQWTPNQNISSVNSQTPIVNPVENTWYFVEVRNNRNCLSTDSVHITVQQEPQIIISPEADTIMIGDTVFLLLNADQENLSFTWTPQYNISCTDCPQPYFYPLESTRYNLLVQDSAACFRHNYYVDIIVFEEYSLDVPGAFTPLGAEPNRVVYVRGLGIKRLIQFRIYNRWGEEVFFTDDINKGWDGYYKGQLQNIDNYGYYVEAEMFNGTIQTKKGVILLMK
ncbi:MAG: PKD domain-containing protein [Bacteroidales bacterium]|jgi:gliding motility-associated-like protein|nr:PKD domain-containing protein [Bacteroidales bacterium]HPD24277.1 PKD domain-containing protein [Bacteroidales bacterium]HRS98648.1 PKD domain-containing protein [Bacteroidales bacterium]HRT80809.1 PKD domain-containing protein [Bacteroidales bacterium]HUM31452.1 PKD domain-containing protein [Bacteroidales bacterium]